MEAALCNWVKAVHALHSWLWLLIVYVAVIVVNVFSLVLEGKITSVGVYTTFNQWNVIEC